MLKYISIMVIYLHYFEPCEPDLSIVPSFEVSNNYIFTKLIFHCCLKMESLSETIDVLGRGDCHSSEGVSVPPFKNQPPPL